MEISRSEAKLIRSLLRRLGEPVPANLEELPIAEPGEYIEGLKSRIEVSLDKRPEWIEPVMSE